MLSLSVWPIKKLGSTLTAFLSSCSLRLWQMHVIFLVLHFAFSLWIGTLFLYSTPPTRSRSRLLCTTAIIINIRVAHTHSALVSMALGRRSFMMSFWKIILHLKDLVFRVFFRNPNWNFPSQLYSYNSWLPDWASIIVGVVLFASHDWTVRSLISYYFLICFIFHPSLSCRKEQFI